MKKLLIVIIGLLVASTAHAQTVANDLVGLGMKAELADYISGILPAGSVLGNNTALKARNAANSADVSILKLDASNDTILLSNAASDIIKFQLESDSNRLISLGAASDTALTMKFGDGGTTAVQQLVISASTADADDDSSLILAGGGADGGTRGASITLPGEEVSGGSDITYNAGTGDTHIFNVAGTTAATISGTAFIMSPAILNVSTNVEAVAGAGTTVADAAALSATKSFHQITGANGTVGWKFPSLTIGDVHYLLNTTAGVAKVYAVSGGTCNGGGADVACTLLSGIAPHLCYATGTNAIICS